MLLKLDDADRRPLYEQIASAVRRALVEGTLGPGDRLPSGRDMAESGGVTLETVQRAYRSLAEEGLVVSRVGRGTSVAPGLDTTTLSLHEDVDRLVARAWALGRELDDVLALIRRRWPDHERRAGEGHPH